MAKNRDNSYRGNRLIKRHGTNLDFNLDQAIEMAKCKADPIYFIETYMKIVSKGKLVNFKLYDYQKDIVRSYQNNINTIVATSRQAGKSTTTCGFILWYVLFHETKNVALLANKAETAREILSRIQFAYENLPTWIQQGVKEWNKGTVHLENDSKILATSTSKDSIRGYTIDFLFIDEAAHIEFWDEFWTAVSQTQSSNPDAKTALVSTPNGLNHFYRYFQGALDGKNNFHAIKVTWQKIPGRDEEWKKNTLEKINNDIALFRQEQEVEFLGSSGTLIAGWKLEELINSILTPFVSRDKLHQYAKPVKDHVYTLVADVSEGKGLDYSAFNVFDVTTTPYKQVCSFRDNMITPTEFAEIIFRAATAYNKAAVLVENNNMGGQVTHILHFDHEYEYVLSTIPKNGPQGKKVSYGYNPKAEKGIRTSVAVKRNGCSLLKLLLEQNQLELYDANTIMELTTFSRHKNSWAAEEGHHDDLTMTLVLFAWLSDSGFFKELTDINILSKLRDRTEEEMLNSLTPFGFVSDGSENEHEDADPLFSWKGDNFVHKMREEKDAIDTLWNAFVYGPKEKRA